MSDSPLLVTVSGPPASGTSTLAERLADEFNLERLNGGDVFRTMAAEYEMELPEFSRLAETDDRIDRELDDRLEGEIDAHLAGRRSSETRSRGLLVESRLAGWHADGRATLAVGLVAPVEVRAARIDDRSETVAELRARERSEAERYRSYYGLEIDDPSVYDLVVDTHTLSPEGVFRTVRTAFEDVR
ncbi:(d)CMP kinase [Natronoglomus mannanivorans]|uniref:Cytidylate kinase n=1 Tax=Natronoglomus mannanivorans TaxID=2979990 RepID=A0AAP2YYJ3_9EURY|nr:cytidylate kinase family protein [Halobacteria archaeon AArc-xg1-1]